MVQIREINTKKDMRKFAKFPLELYRGCAQYVPNIYADEVNLLDEKRNPALEQSEVRCYLAYKEGKLVGRIAAILQKKHNEISGGRYMRFSRFDCIDDAETAAALIGAVESFARERGMTAVHGPWGFNDQDREGLLVEGFGLRATYATNYNYPYYEKLVQAQGYSLESEWVEYAFSIPTRLHERIVRVADFVQKKFELRELAEAVPMSKLIARYGRRALALVNEAYAPLDCYVPVEGRIADGILKKFATVINPRYFSLLVDKNGEVVAIAVLLPSICEPLRASGGRMTPRTLLRILRAIKTETELEMVLIAVRKDYKKKGVNAVMMARIIRNLIEDGITYIESNPILVKNVAVQEQWKMLDCEIVKRRRCYIKQIAAEGDAALELAREAAVSEIPPAQ